jgi:hypothetical protein
VPKSAALATEAITAIEFTVSAAAMTAEHSFELNLNDIRNPPYQKLNSYTAS